MPSTVYLGLGANLGDRRANLRAAIRRLGGHTRLVGLSSVYETEPVGNPEQPLFLNLVCRVTTRLTPPGLLSLAKRIEADLGRVPGPPNSPRPVDIDILFFDDLVIKTPTLTLPHPRLHERAFVLVPLAELAPHLVHPACGRTVLQMLADLPGGSRGIHPAGQLWEGNSPPAEIGGGPAGAGRAARQRQGESG